MQFYGQRALICLALLPWVIGSRLLLDKTTIPQKRDLLGAGADALNRTHDTDLGVPGEQAIGEDGAGPSTSPKVCDTCQTTYRPVCTNMGTKGNECLAQCINATVLGPGPCLDADLAATNSTNKTMKPDTKVGNSKEEFTVAWYLSRLPSLCFCWPGRDPVCGVDGIEYESECVATCKGVAVKNKGKCCECTGIQSLVCGVNGETYASACDARCNGVEVAYPSECQNCFCAEIYSPVCGYDGRTYGNACQANCANVGSKYTGPCVDDDTGLVMVGTSSKPGTSDPQPNTTADPCACALLLDPVCGADNRTYDNRCQAKCQEVSIQHQGPCPEDAMPVTAITISPDPPTVDKKAKDPSAEDQDSALLGSEAPDCPPCLVWDPVCGSNYVTYCNSTIAQCNGVTEFKNGSCPASECACPAQYLPVCGVDHKVYSHSCFARCAHVPVAYEGECEEDKRQQEAACSCPNTLSPVCGVDGHTYTNADCAACAQVKVAHEGPCQDNDDKEPALPRANYTVVGTCDCVAHRVLVCGEDGVTYLNTCEATCGRAKVVKDGPCPPPPNASSIVNNTMADSLTTMPGGGTTDTQVTNSTDSQPKPGNVSGCRCPDVSLPVCGKDNQTHKNACVAQCRKVQIARLGPC